MRGNKKVEIIVKPSVKLGFSVNEGLKNLKEGGERD